MRDPLLIATLLPAAALVAHAEIVDIRWSSDGRFSHKGTVAASKFVEVCGKLPAGLKVLWDFEASAPLDFNVHFHAGKEVMYPSKLHFVATAKDTLDTKIEQDYCWMWSNNSAETVTLTLNLQR